MVEISLKAARINKGLEQSKVADKLGVTVNTLSAWENGKSEPRITQAKKLAALYGLTTDDIFWPSESN